MNVGIPARAKMDRQGGYRHVHFSFLIGLPFAICTSLYGGINLLRRDESPYRRTFL